MRNLINTKRNPAFKAALIDCIAFVGCMVFLCLLLMWGIKQTFAADFEISLGKSLYQTSENGTWYQEGREYHVENHSNSFTLGFADYLTDSIRWHSGYANLGQHGLWSIATSDPDYTGSGCKSNPCAQNAVLITKGHVEGVYFTMAPEYKYKDIKLFMEAGLWAYQAHFNVTIIDQVPTNQVVAQYTKNNDIQVNWVLGAGVEYKNTQLVISAWRVDSAGEQIDTQPSYRGFVTNVSLRHHF